MKVLSVLYVLSVLLAGFTNAIECNFRYDSKPKYDESEIDEILKKSSQMQITNIGVRSSPFRCGQFDESFESLKFASRFGGPDFPDPDEESLCESKKREITPTSLPLASNNNLVDIINTKNIIQQLTIEECVKPDTKCKFDETFPNGYTTKCRQNYLKHTIRAVNPEEAKIYDAEIYYPSSCECKVKLHTNTLR